MTLHPVTGEILTEDTELPVFQRLTTWPVRSGWNMPSATLEARNSADRLSELEKQNHLLEFSDFECGPTTTSR